MSTELRISTGELAHHRKNLDALFRKALKGGAQSHYVISTNSAGGVALVLARNAPFTYNVVSNVGISEIVLVIAAGSKGRLAFSFYEHWETSGSRNFVFSQASLRFYWLYDDGGPQDIQIFRLEWVGMEKKIKLPDEEEYVFVFQGEHAAHPHWHFDRLARYEDRAQLLADLHGNEEEVAVNLDEISDVELERLTAPERSRPLDLRWFPKIHFPALAGWERGEPWDTHCEFRPHQSLPENSKQLESWVYSALCYIKYEVDKHLSLAP